MMSAADAWAALARSRAASAARASCRQRENWRRYRKEPGDGEADETFVFYETRFTPGGCHVPAPAGKIDGAVGFGQ